MQNERNQTDLNKNHSRIIVAFIVLSLTATAIAVPIVSVIYIFDLHTFWQDETDVLNEMQSPDGENTIYIFEKNSGATSGFLYRMTVLKAGENLTESEGNALIADKPFAAAWETNSAITVVLEEGSRICKAEKNVNGISIDYKTEKNGEETVCAALIDCKGANVKQ